MISVTMSLFSPSTLLAEEHYITVIDQYYDESKNDPSLISVIQSDEGRFYSVQTSTSIIIYDEKKLNWLEAIS